MKRVVFLIFAVGLLTTTICSGQSVMTMTTSSDKVQIYLSGSGTFTIDWGDGSESETHTLLEQKYCFDDKYAFRHNYSDTSAHTIKITGDSITHLRCSFNQLTSLDISKNAALTWLDCSNNRLKSLDASKNTKLKTLWCENNNQLTSFKASSALIELRGIPYVRVLEKETVTDNNGIIDISNNFGMEYDIKEWMFDPFVKP